VVSWWYPDLANRPDGLKTEIKNIFLNQDGLKLVGLRIQKLRGKVKLKFVRSVIAQFQGMSFWKNLV